MLNLNNHYLIISFLAIKHVPCNLHRISFQIFAFEIGSTSVLLNTFFFIDRNNMKQMFNRNARIYFPVLSAVMWPDLDYQQRLNLCTCVLAYLKVKAPSKESALERIKRYSFSMCIDQISFYKVQTRSIICVL